MDVIKEKNEEKLAIAYFSSLPILYRENT